MKQLLIILGVISAVLAVIFSVLPISNLAFIPAIFAFILGLVAFYYYKEGDRPKKIIQYVFLLVIIAITIATYKSVFNVSEVNNIEEFQEKEDESVEEPIEELEGLDIEDINIDE